MAKSPQEIRNTYPLPAYNYRVSIASDNNIETISFTEVSGLNLEYEPVIYRHGFSFAMGEQIILGMKQPLKITLRKGVTRQGNYLYQWMDKSYNRPFYGDYKRDIMIDLCDQSGAALVHWTVRKALPVKLEMPTLDASSNEVAIDSVELLAHGLEVDFLD